MVGTIIVTKAEFARRRNVSPSRVTQWITEGKISGEAIHGTGRAARIDDLLACQQLSERLDPDQRRANGLATILAASFPLDDQAARELGSIVHRAVADVLPEIAARLAERLNVSGPMALNELRDGWRAICERQLPSSASDTSVDGGEECLA